MWLYTASMFNIIFQIFAQYHGKLQTLPNSNLGKGVEAKIKIGNVDEQFYCYDHELCRESDFWVSFLLIVMLTLAVTTLPRRSCCDPFWSVIQVSEEFQNGKQINLLRDLAGRVTFHTWGPCAFCKRISKEILKGYPFGPQTADWCAVKSLRSCWTSLKTEVYPNCKCVLFNGWVIFHCVYVPQLSYPFVCW